MNTPADDTSPSPPSAQLSSQAPQTPSSPRVSSSAITFGDLLRRHRTAVNLTQAELAERAGLSVRGINDLERGERISPRRDTLRLLADALGLVGEERAAFEAARHAARKQLSAAPSATSSTADSLPTTGAALPTGTVTFLFTDIESSTQLLQQLGDAYASVLATQQRLLRAAFAAHSGVEVDTQGDSFFVAFPTAPEALAAATEATGALATCTWPERVEVRVRMGLHTGAPQLVGDHYVGLDVHRAARIAAAGHGGQILLSAATAELVRHRLPSDITLRDLGAYRLKDLQQAERIVQVVVTELPADFPMLRALDALPHNLPVQPSALVGREREVEEVTRLLRREDVRLVTLTGTGGIGKTRLSLQVAAEVLDTFPDGVWNIRLSRLTSPTLLLPTVAQVFDLKALGATPLRDVLRTYLRDKRLLLILDNFEQIVAAAPEVADLLGASPGVKALATSRVPLHLRGEHEYTLRPLALPDPTHLPSLASLSQYAAVTLFIERAQDTVADFQVTNQNAPAVAEICARLDGLPLALELAAARVKLLPPPALLKRLERALPLLTGGARDLEERQQTMRATLAWSYELLSPKEQQLFRRLAVFVGGCTLDAVEAVCASSDGAEPLGLDVFEGLNRLIDQGMAQQHEEGGEPRFSLLHVIREYAFEQLERSGEVEALRRAHARYYLALGEQAELELAGPEAVIWLARLECEQDNVRATLSWAQDHGEAEVGLRLAAAIWRFWWQRGHMHEGRAWMEGLLALAAPKSKDTRGVDSAHTGGELSGAEADDAAHIVGAAPDEVRARALFAGGRLALWQGDDATAEAWLEQALALGRAIGDLRTAAYALNDLGDLAGEQGDWQRAAARLEESLALWREAGSQRGMAVALLDRGEVAYYEGDLERSATSITEAQALFRQLSEPDGIAACLNTLGRLARQRGELAQAETLGREALAVHWKHGYVRRCAEDLELLATTAGLAKQEMRAARLMGAAGAQREMLGAPQLRQEHADMERALAAAREAAGEQAWQASFAAGGKLSLAEAIAEALGEDGTNG